MAGAAATRPKGRAPGTEDGTEDRRTELDIKGVPVSVADRFRAVAKAEGATQAEVLDALTAAYEAGMRRDELEAELAEVERRIQEARADLRHVESIREQAEAVAANLHQAATERAQREVGLSRAAVDLLMSLVEMGATRDAILRWGQALAVANIEPEQAARIMERVGGLLQWANQLQAGCEQAEAMRDQVAQEASAARQAKAMLEAQASSLSKTIGEVEADLAAARERARRVESDAREFGVYLDFLSTPGGRVETWTPQVARAIAGAILFAAIQAHGKAPDGNPELQVGPNAALQRILPVRIRLSELPGLLAPPATYAAMLRASQERDAMAKGMVEAPVAEAAGAEG